MALPRILYRDAWEQIDETDDILFITWNPKPRFYPCLSKHDDDSVSIEYNTQWLMMLQKLVLVDRCCRNYGIVAEVSDVGKLHCHGFLVIKDRIKFNKQFLPTLKNNGYIKVTPAKSRQWFEYHVEDLDETVRYIHKYPHLVVLTPATLTDCKNAIFHIECKGARIIEKQRKKLNMLEMFKRSHMVNLDPENETDWDYDCMGN